MCDLDTPLNGLLLHSDTLCVLSYGGPEDPYEDGQEATHEDGQGSSQGDEEEEEKMEKNLPGGGTTAGISGTTAPGPVSENQDHASGTSSGTARYRERGMAQAHVSGTSSCRSTLPPNRAFGSFFRYRQRYEERYQEVPGAREEAAHARASGSTG